MGGMAGLRFCSVSVGLSSKRIKLSDSKHLYEKTSNYQNPRRWQNRRKIGNVFSCQEKLVTPKMPYLKHQVAVLPSQI